MKRFLSLFFVLLLFSCSNDDVESTYAAFHAYFRFDKVMTTAPLYSALTAPGEYCSVYIDNSASNIIFQSTTSSLPVAITSITYYQKIQFIAGLIVGESNVPDMTTMQLPLLAFDRACPNCYEKNSVTKPLSLKESGFAYCDRCKRTYDLNNLGLVVDGQQGDIKLFRYRISYNSSNTMVVSN